MSTIVINPHKRVDSLAVTLPQWLVTETGAVLGDRMDSWVPSSTLDLSAMMADDPQTRLTQSRGLKVPLKASKSVLNLLVPSRL